MGRKRRQGERERNGYASRRRWKSRRGTGEVEAISPQYPTTMTEERGTPSPFRGDWGATRKLLPQEDDSPHSAVSIALSASDVETAVLEGAQLGNLTAPKRREKIAIVFRMGKDQTEWKMNPLESDVQMEEAHP